MRIRSNALVLISFTLPIGLGIVVVSFVALREAQRGDAARFRTAARATAITDAPAGDPAADAVPVAYEQRAVAERDRAVTIGLVGSTRLGRPLRFEGATNPVHGAIHVVLSSPVSLATVRYTPAAGYVGPDEFTFVVSDGQSTSPPARVAIEVAAPRAPLLSNCPQATFDADRHFVVNGDKAFLFGFWSMYESAPTDGWAEYAKCFNSLTDDSVPERNRALAQYGVFLQAQGGLRLEARAPARIDTKRIASAAETACIISWETQHEPDSFPATDISSDVALQAKAIREADPCQRLVMVTPQAGAGARFGEYAKYTDYTAVEWYPTPSLALNTLAAHIDAVKALIGGQPFVYVYRITGHQPTRYREYGRQPTAREVRAATYLAVLHGASGVSLFSYSQGVADNGRYGFAERNDARHCISDSGELYSELKRVGREVRALGPLLVAPRSPIVAVADHPGIECAIWDVNGELPGGEYLICVNAADEPSPFFEYVSGERCEQIEATVLAPDGRTFPRDLPERPWHTLSMAPSSLYLRCVDTGIWNKTESINRARVRVESALPGTRVQFAIYVDEHRDRGPGRKVHQSDWIVIPAAGGWLETTLSPPVVLEHTRHYFVAVRVDREGVSARFQDVRYGARPRPGAATFADAYPPLHQGQRVTSTIALRGGTFGAYCATRSLDDQVCRPGTVTENRITDTLEPYAVHIYQLIR